MKPKMMTFIAAALALLQSSVFAHGGGKNVKLHVNPKWDECSFQLDPSLTQKQWRQFTREAGLVAYFRPLTDAMPLGTRNYEFSILKWETAIDETEGAWNNTFVHPDSLHSLTGGEPLGFPGLTFRMGVTERLDIGAYWTQNFAANYGFWGAQIQYSLINDLKKNWAASARLSLVSLYGPEDLNLNIYGVDLMASKKYTLLRWASVSPYAGISTYLSSSHEKTAAVNLHDENTIGVQSMIGVLTQISKARIAAEYNFARVNSFSIKLGVAF
ncbi:hypothetical protein JNL27_13410 [bacterium]|nr:hypothetical protein [bacterium]